jgi:hypothetical protein
VRRTPGSRAIARAASSSSAPGRHERVGASLGDRARGERERRAGPAERGARRLVHRDLVGRVHQLDARRDGAEPRERGLDARLVADEQQPDVGLARQRRGGAHGRVRGAIAAHGVERDDALARRLTDHARRLSRSARNARRAVGARRPPKRSAR